MYFEKFPLVGYKFDGFDDFIVVSDITKNVRIKAAVLEAITLYDEYDIQSGDTPEIISEKLYGSPLYHWVIMLANQRYDWKNDFPLEQPELDRHVLATYGDDSDAIHHYLNSKGFIVSSDHPEAVSVSNRQYEDDLNESKRRIKIINPNILKQILTEFENI